MNINTKRLRKNCWEMHLVSCGIEYPTIEWILKQRHGHDQLVTLILEELLAWEGVMYSRKAYDQWHWYDKPEMDRFVTYMLLKHGEK